MSEIALPRIRTRRKKRKPPRPEFWWRLFQVSVDLLIITINGTGFIFSVAVDEIGFWAGLSIFWVGIASVWLKEDWPKFKRELDLWLKDDEE